MKNAKWIVPLSCLITVALLVCCFLFPFTRTAENAWTHLFTVSINDSFNAADVENAMREAGASDVLVLKQVTRTGNTTFEGGTTAQVYFLTNGDTDANEVVNKAEEILSRMYGFKFPGTLSVLSTTLTKQSVFTMWPVLIVLVVILAYAFLRFGVKNGAAVAVQLIVPCVCTLGVVALARIGLSTYSIAALYATAALSLMFAFVFAFVERDCAKKMTEGVLQAATKKVNLTVAVLTCMAIVGLVPVLIFGNAMLQGFALTALIGTAFCACCAVFTTPAFVSLTGKAN